MIKGDFASPFYNTQSSGGGANAVTAAANLTDDAVVVGDGGAKGIKTIASLGTSGQVLTSQGAGLPPVFMAPGEIISIFDATVGASGADYTTISGALAAGKSRLLAIANVTETADCALPAGGLYIYIEKGFTLAMGTHQFTCAGNRNLTIIGQDRTSALTFGYGASKFLVNGSTFANNVVLDTLAITNTSSAADCYLVDGTSANAGSEVYKNLVITLPNFSDCGINTWSTNSTIQNVEIIGGGVACALGITTGSGDNAKIQDITVSGTYIASASGYAISIQNAVFNGIVLNHTGDAAITFGIADGSGIYLSQNSAYTTAVVELSTGPHISDIDIDGNGAGVRILKFTGATSTTFCSNFRCNTIVDAGSTLGPSLSNGRVNSASTINGDLYTFTNVRFIGGATIVSGADNNTFVACQAGADAGGGAATFTVNAGSNNTQIVASKTDVAISDAGTGTVLSSNIIY